MRLIALMIGLAKATSALVYGRGGVAIAACCAAPRSRRQHWGWTFCHDAGIRTRRGDAMRRRLIAPVLVALTLAAQPAAAAFVTGCCACLPDIKAQTSQAPPPVNAIS